MRTYGLIGYPLSHSFSRRFFTEYFEENAIPAQYLNYEISDISLLPGVIDNNRQLIGFNVTIPYKQAVIAYLDDCDPAAAKLQAVNTVRIERSGDQVKLKGYNTDLPGFRNSLKPLLKSWHKKALVLGTGGASKAVLAALRELSLPSLQVSRNASEGKTIAYQDVDKAVMDEYTIVINTTPLGTFPKVEGLPDLPYHHLSDRHLLYDLVYNPAVTAFLQKGIDNGASVKNGLEMLELQAMAAWEIWNR